MALLLYFLTVKKNPGLIQKLFGYLKRSEHHEQITIISAFTCSFCYFSRKTNGNQNSARSGANFEASVVLQRGRWRVAIRASDCNLYRRRRHLVSVCPRLMHAHMRVARDVIYACNVALSFDATFFLIRFFLLSVIDLKRKLIAISSLSSFLFF